MLRAWVVRDMEPLPIDPGNRRLMRGGLLSRALAESGHETTWFTSNFDHYRQCFRHLPRGLLDVQEKLKLYVLQGTGYSRNVSARRVWHNMRFATAFLAAAQRAESKPDVILTDIPTTEAAAAAIYYATANNIPSILSVRDLWPDTFARYVSRPLHKIVPLLSLPMQCQAKFACRNATSLVGISADYLDWGLRKGARVKSDSDIVIPLSHYPMAVDEEDISAMRDALGLRPGQRIVAFVGSWGGSIRLDWLAEVARQHLDRDDVTFVVGGDGESRSHSNSLKNLPNVVLTGWLDARDLAVLLSTSELALLPYACNAPQSIPNKVYDYMAYGVFQIGTLSGATAELYADSGIGRATSPSASGLAKAVGDHLDMPPAQTRDDIKRLFSGRYHASSIYSKMVRHVEGVVEQQRNARRPGP